MSSQYAALVRKKVQIKDNKNFTSGNLEKKKQIKPEVTEKPIKKKNFVLHRHKIAHGPEIVPSSEDDSGNEFQKVQNFCKTRFNPKAVGF